MHFIETPIFTRLIRQLLDDAEYQRLQIARILRPELGDLIRGSGGIRKARWGVGSRGKRGGIRVIYYWDPARETCYMLYVYPKNERDDLSAAQLRTLRSIVDEEFQ